MKQIVLTLFFSLIVLTSVYDIHAEETEKSSASDPKVDPTVVGSKDGSKTDDEVVSREEEAISLDGLNVAQIKELREKSEKFTFQAEVDRMMKLIINSLYKNKEIFLRELISNASDALDKIRFLSVTDPKALDATPDLNIKIKGDKDQKMLRITDTGIGMTKEDLVKNLGTIAKSGTSDFLKRLSESKSSTEMSDLIGQFGVGFYSSFLVADRVTVVSKHNDDDQYVWESDASSFSVIKDPRGNTLKRGTEIILHLKEEAHDYLEPDTLKNLVTKYSQFINFPIYLWSSKVETVEEPATEEEKKDKDDAKKTDEKKDDEKKDDDDATVEEEKDKEKKKTKKVEKTVWDWELVNKNKPIWTRKPADIKEEEYTEFYKAFSKDSEGPLTKIHFTAEGEVTFKSILYVPKKAPFQLYNQMHEKTDNIKMYVRRVFITDDFSDMMPKYLNFIKGIVDSDDLPLNVSREQLQQHKLLKVIKKKLVRKTLDMLKKLSAEDYEKFYKEFSTSIKLGVIEDTSNRTRLAKLLRFYSSHDDTKMTSLEDYVSRMKEKQGGIFFMAGTSKAEVKSSPFVERLLKKGYEVLYMTEPIDEYTVQSLPEFDGKKLQNVAKEGLNIDDSTSAKEKKEALTKEYQPLLNWLKDEGLKDLIEKAEISDRLADSPCALVASTYAWSGNMERIMRAQAYQKAEDPSQNYYASQKKILEINPRHPVIKELKSRVEKEKDSPQTKNLALILLDTSTLRSGFAISDSAAFAQRVEGLLRKNLDIPADEKVDEDEEETPTQKDSAASGNAESASSATDSKAAEEGEKPKEEL